MTTSQIDIIAIVNGRLRVGCQACRRVWDTSWADTLWCACGVHTPVSEAWARADGHVPRATPPSTSAVPPSRWSSQAHRTAMVAVLILVVSLWAVPLCVLLATECRP